MEGVEAQDGVVIVIQVKCHHMAVDGGTNDRETGAIGACLRQGHTHSTQVLVGVGIEGPHRLPGDRIEHTHRGRGTAAGAAEDHRGDLAANAGHTSSHCHATEESRVKGIKAADHATCRGVNGQHMRRTAPGHRDNNSVCV